MLEVQAITFFSFVVGVANYITERVTFARNHSEDQGWAVTCEYLYLGRADALCVEDFEVAN